MNRKVNNLDQFFYLVDQYDHKIRINKDQTVSISTNNQDYNVVSGLKNIVQVDCGLNHYIALKNDGSVYTWGQNQYGQLGNGDNQNSDQPFKINLKDVLKISAGENHNMALNKYGQVYCWGLNNNGQLGNNTTTNKNSPVQIVGQIIDIDAGGNHSLAVKSNRKVYSWGQNDDGQLGVGTTDNSLVPIKVKNLSNICKVFGGLNHSLAITCDGVVYTWGNNQLEPQLVKFKIKHCHQFIYAKVYDDNYIITCDGTLFYFGKNVSDNFAIHHRNISNHTKVTLPLNYGPINISNTPCPDTTDECCVDVEPCDQNSCNYSYNNCDQNDSNDKVYNEYLKNYYGTFRHYYHYN